MKKWQYGTDIERLKLLSDFFKESDGEVLKSPFTEMTKPSVAVAIRDNKLLEYEDHYVIRTNVKVNNAVKDFSGNIIANKKKGDLYISRFAYKNNNVFDTISELSSNVNTWIDVWQEKADEVDYIKSLGFSHVCSKITSHSEIIGIYYKGSDNNITTIPNSQTATLCKIREVSVNKIIKEIDSLALGYTNHFSNYNPTNSWSALSLRGYLSDYTFISKPDVMGKKWDNKTKEDFELQFTELWEKLPSVKNLLNEVFPIGTLYDRIRIMKLGSKNGILERHSDKTEKNAGVNDGNLARFHFPLYTNDKVFFEMWDLSGKHIVRHLPVGEMWYLDMRKPHRAINNGNSERIHLVVDVISNSRIRSILGDIDNTIEEIFE